MKFVIEILVVIAIGYAIWHEDALVLFEQQLAHEIKRRFKKITRKINGIYLEALRKSL